MYSKVFLLIFLSIILVMPLSLGINHPSFGYGGGGGGGGGGGSGGGGGKISDPRVCGDKLCSEIPGGRSAWEEKSEPVSQNKPKIAYFPPPLKQIKDGIEPSHVTCTEGLELVLKQSNGKPACVKPSSIPKLIERGWAIHVLPDYDDENNNSEIFAQGNFKVDTKLVNYFDNSEGFLAKPTSEDQFPGVVMIHEWWGLNENIKEMAEKLASHGYVVLAVDLYNGEVAATSDEARQLISSFDQNLGIENMNSAASYLQENYNAGTLGSIGWCFGGGQSLNLALNNENMDATIIYYGQLQTDPQVLSSINWPVLGIFAELDKGITVQSVSDFEASLNELSIPNDIHVYSSVDHAFANPSGDRYAPDEAKDAWQKTLEFFKENLK